jgi:hypothetical protein
LKHGGQFERVDVDVVELPLPLPDDELLALDEALDRLAAVDQRAELVRAVPPARWDRLALHTRSGRRSRLRGRRPSVKVWSADHLDQGR